MASPINRFTWLRWLSAAVVGCVLPLEGGGTSITRNEPVLTGDTGAHDPTLWVGASGHHVFTTGPGIQRLHSKDGLQWERRAPVFTAETRPAWWATAVPAQKGIDVWAPKVFQHRGRFWVMYSISTFGKNASAIGLASAESPEATRWRDDGVVVQSQPTDNFNAIDPDVWVDEAKGVTKVWMTYGSFWGGIRLTELDATTLKPIGETRFVAQYKPGIEAPTLIRRGDWYYLFVSYDRCCKGVESTYNIRVGRSSQPTGPFVDRHGRDLMDGGGTLIEAGAGRWIGPGHQDVFEHQGTHWLVRHAYDAEDGGKPKLRRAPLQWGADGWPSL